MFNYLVIVDEVEKTKLSKIRILLSSYKRRGLISDFQHLRSDGEMIINHYFIITGVDEDIQEQMLGLLKSFRVLNIQELEMWQIYSDGEK